MGSNYAKRLRWLYRAWRYRLLVERPEVQFVLEHLQPGDFAVDVGAHKGALLYWILNQVGPTGKVAAFEPQPELAKYLSQLLEGTSRSNARVINAALSSRPGVTRLIRWGNKPSPGARLTDDFMSEEAIAAHVSFAVRVEVLDDALPRDLRPVKFIKCDAEGHELEVFKGARQILEEDRPLLLFECERRHHHGQTIEPVFDFLDQLGYAGCYMDQKSRHDISKFRPELQDDPESPSYVNNFAFFPRSAPRRTAYRRAA
jgi:FkbM family methyltransferase